MTNNDNLFFTLYTATYNRKHLLPRAYESVKKQTIRDFEWLIIDDGSTDDTEELVRSWQQEADFPIIYKWKPNGGKHTALERVAELARGKLLISLDSDDELIPQTLERFKFYWDGLSEKERTTVGCIICLTEDQDGNIFGDKYPKDVQIADFMYMYLVKKIKGEKGAAMEAGMFRQSYYRGNVKNVYVPEEVFIQRMAKEWKVLCINEALRIYWVDHREDHDGANMLKPKNFPGNRLLHLAYLNYSMRLFWKVPRLFAANAVYYCKLSFHLGLGVRKQLDDIETGGGRLLWLLAVPVGYFLYRKERSRLAAA